jgi:hypothetical protein
LWHFSGFSHGSGVFLAVNKGEKMIVTFDEKRGRFRVTQNETVDGKRIRKTKLCPEAWTEAQAYQFAERMLSARLPWKDQLRKSILSKPQDRGAVYLIKNEYMRGLIKIGMTRNTVHERIRNLGTAHPGKWLIVESAIFNHAEDVERALHRHFADRREEKGREFFRITDDMAIAALRECHEVDGVSLTSAVNGIGRDQQ